MAHSRRRYELKQTADYVGAYRMRKYHNKQCPNCGSEESKVVDIDYMGPGCAGWTAECLNCHQEFHASESIVKEGEEEDE